MVKKIFTTFIQCRLKLAEIKQNIKKKKTGTLAQHK